MRKTWKKTWRSIRHDRQVKILRSVHGSLHFIERTWSFFQNMIKHSWRKVARRTSYRSRYAALTSNEQVDIRKLQNSFLFCLLFMLTLTMNFIVNAYRSQSLSCYRFLHLMDTNLLRNHYVDKSQLILFLHQIVKFSQYVHHILLPN